MTAVVQTGSQGDHLRTAFLRRATPPLVISLAITLPEPICRRGPGQNGNESATGFQGNVTGN